MKIIFALLGILLFVVTMFYGKSLIRVLASGYLIFTLAPYERFISVDAPKILVAGDSTAYGTGARDTDETIAGRIGNTYPKYSIFNKGVNGRTIGELVEVFLKMDEQEQYKLVLLQIGANDILKGHTDEKIRADLTQLFGAVSKHSEHIVMMSSGNVGAASAFVKNRNPDQELEARSREVRELFLELAAVYGVEYIDLFAEPEDDVFLINPEMYMAIDGLHPSGAGYGVWYESLQPVLDRVLQYGERGAVGAVE